MSLNPDAFINNILEVGQTLKLQILKNVKWVYKTYFQAQRKS